LTLVLGKASFTSKVTPLAEPAPNNMGCSHDLGGGGGSGANDQKCELEDVLFLCVFADEYWGAGLKM
jgi:hypothetical protein